MTTALDDLDAARAALLACLDRPPAEERRFLAGAPDLDEAQEIRAIARLDAAGAVEAVLDSDWWGTRRWRVRAVTPAGREVARLIRDDLVWARLRRDLARDGEPFEILVRTYRTEPARSTEPA
jgi:hypothetical protein